MTFLLSQRRGSSHSPVLRSHHRGGSSPPRPALDWPHHRCKPSVSGTQTRSQGGGPRCRVPSALGGSCGLEQHGLLTPTVTCAAPTHQDAPGLRVARVRLGPRTGQQGPCSSVSDMGWRPRARGGPPSTDRLLSGLVPASQARDTVPSVAVLGRGLSRMPRPLLKSTLRFTETAP